MGLLAEWKTYIMGTPTTLSRGSVKDACSMRYASGEKARRILGYEARIGIEEGLRVSCLVSFASSMAIAKTDLSSSIMLANYRSKRSSARKGVEGKPEASWGERGRG